MTTDSGAAATEPQAVIAPLTGAAIFLVVVLTPGQDRVETLRGLCADLAALVRAVGFRDPLVNMFTGSPEGNYDRLLDFSTAKTGSLFFVPAVPLLETLGAAAGTGETTAPARPAPGSLTIGSLKGAPGDG